MSCFFISDLVNTSVFSKICSVPQIAAEDVSVLAKKTKLSKKEIISQYKDFIARYPSGEMDRKQFVKHLQPIHENLVIGENSIFSVLDKDSSGTIKFLDFMLAENSVFIECAEDKLIWIFDVCDTNGKDALTGTEIYDVVTRLFAMVGIRIEKSILAARTEELVEAIAQDNEREITKSEFVNNAMKCEFVSDIINDDVVNGLSQL